MRSQVIFFLVFLSLLCPGVGAQRRPTRKPLATLEIKVQIVSASGRPQPVARTPFYLLETDPAPLLENMGLSEDPKVDSNGFALLRLYCLTATKKNKGTLDGRDVIFVTRVSETLKAHVLYERITDVNGQMGFQPIRRGGYWLFGFTETKGGVAIWSLPIELAKPKTQFSLSTENALMIE